jgi:predicted dinucleotide-binding enzyme
MKIGIIGIGQIGGMLARRWSANGHGVRVANSRGREAVRPFAEEIGAEPADPYEAVDGADVVVLAMPFPAVATLPKDLFGGATDDLVIVDVANYYPDVRDPRIAEIDAGMPESVWVSAQLGRPVFKAFNSVMFHTLSELGRPEGAPGRLAIPVAGDGPRGKQIVMGLINEIGFDPVDAGTLEDSWRQQPSTPAYCCDYDAERTRAGLKAAVRGQAETLRDTVWRERYVKLFANGRTFAEAHPDVIALNRSLTSAPR